MSPRQNWVSEHEHQVASGCLPLYSRFANRLRRPLAAVARGALAPPRIATGESQVGLDGPPAPPTTSGERGEGRLDRDGLGEAALRLSGRLQLVLEHVPPTPAVARPRIGTRHFGERRQVRHTRLVLQALEVEERVDADVDGAVRRRLRARLRLFGRYARGDWRAGGAPNAPVTRAPDEEAPRA